MRHAGVVAFIGLLMLSAPSFAQTETPPRNAIDLKDDAIQATFKRAAKEIEERHSSLWDRLSVLSDMGKYNVGVAVVARPEGKDLKASLSHDKITEVYYVLRGGGTQVTGTMVDGVASAATNGPSATGPGKSSNSPLQNTHVTKLKPGDIQIIPPNVGHGFTSVDAGGIEYLLFRFDPDKALAMP